MVFPNIFYVDKLVFGHFFIFCPFFALETIIWAAVRDSWLKYNSSWLNPLISALVKKRSFFGIDSFWHFKFNSSEKLFFYSKSSLRIGSAIFHNAIKKLSGDSVYSLTRVDTILENKTTDFLLIILQHKFG